MADSLEKGFTQRSPHEQRNEQRCTVNNPASTRGLEPDKLGWFVQAQLPEECQAKSFGWSSKLLRKAEITVVVGALN